MLYAISIDVLCVYLSPSHIEQIVYRAFYNPKIGNTHKQFAVPSEVLKLHTVGGSYELSGDITLTELCTAFI